MIESKKERGILGLLLVSLLIAFFAIYYRYQNQNVLKIGIYSGSSWNVPGTSYYELFQEAIDKFHQDYPNIKVEFQEGIPAEDYSEWLSSEILKGREPDVFLVLPDDFVILQRMGALKNLNEEILNDSNVRPKMFYEAAYKAGMSNNIQYALPFVCNPKLMFVNKTLLKENGIAMPTDNWTWDDFYQTCHQIKQDVNEDGEIDQYGFYDYSWQDAVYSNGKSPFLDDGSDSCFTDQHVIDSVIFLKKMMELHRNHTGNYNDFDLGKVAFRPLSFSEYRTYMPYPWRIKKFSQFEWNCASMPAGPNGDNTSSMETLLLGMSARTLNKKMAWEFMRILTTDEEIQTHVFKNTAGVSPVKKVTCSNAVVRILNEDIPGDSRIDMSLLDRVMTKAVNPKHFQGYNEVMQYSNSYINEFLERGEEINISMFQLEKQMNKILK